MTGFMGMMIIISVNAIVDHTIPGTSSYMSPEMIQGSRYSEKVDVYSFGILLWEMYTRKVPFKSMHAIQVAQKVSMMDNTWWSGKRN